MPKAVVILGAGSSADFGVPVLSRIFTDDQVRRYIQNNPGFHEILNETIWAPRGLTLDSAFKGPTVEDILTMLRDWERAHERDPEIVPSPPELISFRKNLYSLIQRAVFEGKSSRRGHLNALITRFKRGFEKVTWATFNWDCIFEASFYYSSDLPWPAGLRGNPSVAVDLEGWRGGNSRHLLLKLHGGINWWLIDGRLKYLSWGGGQELQRTWREYEESPQSNAQPVILEPSFYKYTDSPAFQALRVQWNVFFHNLIEPDYVVVIGYSLPDLDTYAREMFLVAFQINSNCRWLIVDPNSQICERYSRILGTNKVTIREETLSGFNNDLDLKLRQAFPELECST